MNKIEEKFTKNPKELKYKCEIINCEDISNISLGYNNKHFDIYTSYKDKNPYIVLVNKYKSALDIYSLFTRQKITVLRGNKEEIKTVKNILLIKTIIKNILSQKEDMMTMLIMVLC